MPTIETRVAAQTDAVQLVPLRPERRAVIVFNDSQAVLRLRLGAKPTPTVCTEEVGPKGRAFYEHVPDPIYGSWATAEGWCNCTESL